MKKIEKSKVPHFQFSSNENEQIEQLKNNELIERFKRSREERSEISLKPIYHFTSPESHLNDPNGLCFWNNKWHLFYQAYPPEDTRLHWGHAVSDDLLHWEDLPYAIYPHPENCCFSGSALVEDDRVIAMYHGTECGNMVAVSYDPLLLNWEKLTNDAVIKPGRGFPIFDPYLFKEGDYYYALSGSFASHHISGNKTRNEFMCRSKNLVDWEYMHPFIENDGFAEIYDDGACPYFLPFGKRYILLHFSHANGGKWIIGDYDKSRHRFLPCNGGKFNSISPWSGSLHAPSATLDSNGDVICIFNVNSGYNVGSFDQVMSLPYRLIPSGEFGDSFSISPAVDTSSLRNEHTHLENITLPANEEIILPASGNAIEIRAVFNPPKTGVLELSVLTSQDGDERTSIQFYPRGGAHSWILNDKGNKWDECKEGALCIDTSKSSLLPNAKISAPKTTSISLDNDELLRIRIFVDKSIVEVFANDKVVLASRAYPAKADSTGIRVVSRCDSSELLSFDCWDMKKIF